MNKTVVKRNKKEEQKKLMVRIVCFALVIALAVTSLLAMFPTLFQQETTYSTIEEMIEAGILYQNEDGSYSYTEEYLNSISHEGHDHD